MKGKLGIIITCVVIVCAIVATAITVFALTSNSGKNRGGNGSGRQFSEQAHNNLQKNSEAWSKLTDVQKKDCYAILDEINASQIKLIDKEIELGLIDTDNAAQMKEMLKNQLSTIKENDRMPTIGGFGGGRGAGMAPSDNPSSTDSSPAA